MTAAVKTPAAGNAQSAASVRQVIATVAAERSVNTASAGLSWSLLMTRNAAANRNAPIEPEDTPSIFPGSAGGPYFSPDTISAADNAKAATTCNKCAVIASVWSGSAPAHVQSTPIAVAVTASHRQSLMRASVKAAAMTTAR